MRAVGRVADWVLVAASWASRGSGASSGWLGGLLVGGEWRAVGRTARKWRSTWPPVLRTEDKSTQQAPHPSPLFSYFIGLSTPPSLCNSRRKCALLACPLAPHPLSGENWWQFSAFDSACPRRDRTVAPRPHCCGATARSFVFRSEGGSLFFVRKE